MNPFEKVWEDVAPVVVPVAIHFDDKIPESHAIHGEAVSLERLMAGEYCPHVDEPIMVAGPPITENPCRDILTQNAAERVQAESTRTRTEWTNFVRQIQAETDDAGKPLFTKKEIAACTLPPGAKTPEGFVRGDVVYIGPPPITYPQPKDSFRFRPMSVAFERLLLGDWPVTEKPEPPKKSVKDLQQEKLMANYSCLVDELEAAGVVTKEPENLPVRRTEVKPPEQPVYGQPLFATMYRRFYNKRMQPPSAAITFIDEITDEADTPIEVNATVTGQK